MDQLLNIKELRSTYRTHRVEAQKKRVKLLSEELTKHLLTFLVSLKDHLNQQLLDKCKQAVPRRELFVPFFTFFTTHSFEGRPNASMPHSSFLQMNDGTSESLFVLVHHGDVLDRVRKHLGPSLNVSIKQETSRSCTDHYIVREKIVLEFFPDRVGEPSVPIPTDLRVHSQVVM